MRRPQSLSDTRTVIMNAMCSRLPEQRQITRRRVNRSGRSRGERLRERMRGLWLLVSYLGFQVIRRLKRHPKPIPPAADPGYGWYVEDQDNDHKTQVRQSSDSADDSGRRECLRE